MLKVPTDKTTRSFDELSSFVSRQDVIDALEKAAKNNTLLRKAKADAKTFFRGEGIKLPPRADLTISARRVTGQLTVCVEGCTTVLGIRVCAKACIVIAF